MTIKMAGNQNAPSKIQKQSSDGALDNHTQTIEQTSSDFIDDEDLSIGAEEQSQMISHAAPLPQQPEVPMLRPQHDVRRAEIC